MKLDEKAPPNGADADLLLARAVELDRVGELDPAGAPPGAPPGSPPPPPQGPNWDEEAKNVVGFCRGTFLELYPRLKTVWTDEKLVAVERALGPVLKKHNISLDRIFGKWAEEIGLAFVLVPQLMPSARAVRDDLAELRAQEAERARAAPKKGEQSSPPPKAPPAPVDASSGSETPRPPPDTTQLHQKV